MEKTDSILINKKTTFKDKDGYQMDLTMNRKEQTDKLIKEFAYGSSLTGFIPIPFVDTLGLIGVQRLMIYKLSKIYEIPHSKELAKAWISTLMGGLTTSAVSPLLGSAVKLIPGIGTLAGGTTMAVLGSSSTYAIGKVFQHHFEKGGTLDNFDPETAKEMLHDELEKGITLSKKK